MEKRFEQGNRVEVFGFTGEIDDTYDAPEYYGVIFEAHGREYSVPAELICSAD